MTNDGGPIEDCYSRDVRRSLLNLCLSALPLSLAANLINGALLSLVLATIIEWAQLAVWYALIVIMVLVRFHLMRRQQRSADPGARHWYALFIAGCATSGALWGSAGWVFQDQGGVIGDSVLGFVLGGMGAGALASLAPCLCGFYVYFIPSILPFAIKLALAEGVHYWMMAAMCAIYLVSFIFLAAQAHSWLVRSLRLRFENSELISSLEERVEERTRQLREANALLAQDIELRERAQATLADYGDRQAAVAMFGQRALSGVGLDTLFEEAAQLIVQRLKVASCAIIQRAGPEELRTSASAGKGLGAGVSESQGAAYAPAKDALAGGGNLMIADVADGPSFASYVWHRDAGARSIAEIVIKGPDGPCGIIEAVDDQCDRFSADDVSFMQAIANLLAAAVGRKRTESDIQRMAMEDALTGLPNRTDFRDRLLRELAAASSQRMTAVMLLDLDHFKDVNDTLGHPIGDQLLIAVAGRLKGCVREEEPPARLGGDEFALILSNLRHTEDATGIARKVINSIAQPFMIDGHEVRLGASIGVTLCPLDSTDPDELLRNADLALYRAKEQGRNAYEFYAEDMAAAIEGRKSLERDLRQAIDGHHGLHVCYQPQFRLRDGRVVAVEALLRWSHARRGMLMPDAFIPVAEASGLIVPLGALVLEKACRQASEWLQPGIGDLTLAVNLSLSQCRRGDLVDMVQRVAERCRFDLGHLELEVTEQIFLPQEDLICTDVLRRLRLLGVKVSIDDFGTGYSSFGRLRSLPVDKLKIDHCFVAGLGRDRDSELIVRSMIVLGRSLGLEVVAEGVENQDQLDFLLAEECDAVQGLFLAAPLPAAEIPQLRARLWSHDRSGAARQAI